MMTRSEIHNRFVERFAVGIQTPCLPEALKQVEKALNTRFPQSFIRFATCYGAVHTPGIQDLVTVGDPDHSPEGLHHDVLEFFSANDMLKTTEAYRSAGMDDALVVVASDCMGNVFGFRIIAGTERPDDAPVHVFDHGQGRISAVAPSFDGWLKSFVDLKQPDASANGM